MENKSLKIVTFILAFIVIIQVIGTILYFRNFNQLLSTNIKKTDALITEIGDIKAENQILNQKYLQTSNTNVHPASEENIFNTDKTDSDQKQQEYQDYLKTTQVQLIQENNSLNQQINQIQEQQKKIELNNKLKEVNQQIVPVLILGQNQNLTDTIILAIVNPTKKKTTLLSIPRDLYYEGRKINEYSSHYGIEKTDEIIQKITGIKPQKNIEIDFAAFEQFVDALGGIDLNIEKDLIDKNYPAENNQVQTVSFKAGFERMTGTRALQYARTRKSTSDFDRGLRQQKILLAIKDKIKAKDILSDIQFFIDTYNNISSHVETNFTILEAIQYFDQYKDYQISAGNILNSTNYLYSSKSLTGQYILLPRNNSFDQFQQKLLEII